MKNAHKKRSSSIQTLTVAAGVSPGSARRFAEYTASREFHPALKRFYACLSITRQIEFTAKDVSFGALWHFLNESGYNIFEMILDFWFYPKGFLLVRKHGKPIVANPKTKARSRKEVYG